MPDRRIDFIARERIEEIAQGYERFTHRVTWYLRAFVLLFFVAAVVFTFQEIALNSRANETRRLTEANGQLTREIQAERARSVRDGCEAQNQRHDGTIKTLNRLIDKLPSGPQRERAIHNRDSTVVLIEALVPKRDCEAQVRATVGRHR